MTSLPKRIASDTPRQPLHDTAASRRVERAALAQTAPFALMARAGADAAKLALALAPHAQRIWIAAGPGNNGGDGLVAARLLRLAGKHVWVTCLGDPQLAPADARRAFEEAQAAGVVVSGAVDPAAAPDLAIDALLGLGQQRPPGGQMAEVVRRLNALSAPVLALDLPTGLCTDSGRALGADAVRARATLSLLTLKPGLFTAQGRDLAGEVWWSTLGLEALPMDLTASASSSLSGTDDADLALPPRLHAQHKGSYGDLWVIGGAPGMAGASRLASRAALVAGAGRVYLSPLDPAASDDPGHPEVMQRSPTAWRAAGLLEPATVVCGCGGGDAMAQWLPAVLRRAGRLVLDADALNAIANDTALANSLAARGRAGRPTVLTPHPLEAARLLNTDAASVQADRLAAAQQLAERFAAVVVLKGSGSVVAAPGLLPVINPTGNARLATAGTGDVLAGWLGGLWSCQRDTLAPDVALAHRAAVAACWWHGSAAERPDSRTGSRLPLTAGALIDALAHVADDH